MADPPLRFVILGGGTAGWMTACLLAKKWPQHDIVVVESPDIGIIGVGEGSTPQLKAFFDTLGVAEADWMPKCNATYKAGISFHKWSERPSYERYFHPFHTELDHFTDRKFFFQTRARRTGRNVEAHPDRFFLPTRIAAERRAPVAATDYPHAIGYGYHFDATLVGQTLRDHAVNVLGVTHLARTVNHVQIDSAGQVEALHTRDDETIKGDFFVDCSGFGGTIIQKALNERFISFGDNLFNDSAVAMPTSNDEGDIPSETKATALSTGWAWRIPLTNRAGNGYVYSSRYTDADAAEIEIRRHLGLLDSDTPARHLRMNVGRLERCWVGNCLAVGLSHGFIEPLEATALHIVQTTVEGFIEAFERGGATNQYAAELNSSLAERIEGIRDYIVAHYRMNQRHDSAYWRDNAHNDALSENLRALMTAWFTGADLTAEIRRLGIGRYYSALSWHCLFAGYGTFPSDDKLVASLEGLDLADLTEVDAFITSQAARFPSHNQALKYPLG